MSEKRGLRRGALARAAGVAGLAAGIVIALGVATASGDRRGGAARVEHLRFTGGPLSVVVDAPGGPFAQQNRLIIQGMTLALATLNAAGGAGGQRVTLVTDSLDGLSPAAVQARLHAAGHSAVLVLPCDSDSQASLAAGAARYGTLMLAPCDADPSLARRLATYWPVGMSGSDEAGGLAGFMKTLGAGAVFVVDTRGLSFATTMAGEFRTAARAAGIRVVGSGATGLAPTAAQASSVARAILAARPRPAAVFSALPPPYVDELAGDLAVDGVHALMIGTSAMDTPLALAGTGEGALENAILPSYGFLRQTPQADAFLADYTQRYGRPVGAFPGLGFDTIGLLQDAMGKARSTSPVALQAALLGGIDDAGVALFARAYHDRSDHNPITSVSVEKIYDDSFEPLRTVQPAGTAGP